MKDAVVASPPPFAVCIKKRLFSASANNAYGDCQRCRCQPTAPFRPFVTWRPDIMSVNQHLLFIWSVCDLIHVSRVLGIALSPVSFQLAEAEVNKRPLIVAEIRSALQSGVPRAFPVLSVRAARDDFVEWRSCVVRACVCLSIVSVVSLRDQRALSNEPDRMTSHSVRPRVRSRRKSTNLPQRARARGALPSLSLRPRRLLNYYSHLPLLLIKLARPTVAAASSRVAYSLTGFFKSKLITISREQRHSHARAGRGRQTGSRRGEAGGEEQRVDGKINFPSEYCASPRSVVGWMGDRPTDNRAKSTIAIVLLHFLSTTSPQWQSPPFAMDERAAMGGISQVAQPVHSQSQS